MTFNTEIINKVKTNWLFKEKLDVFRYCKTDNDICLLFVKVSNMTGMELGLSKEISDIVISKLK